MDWRQSLSFVALSAGKEATPQHFWQDLLSLRILVFEQMLSNLADDSNAAKIANISALNRLKYLNLFVNTERFATIPIYFIMYMNKELIRSKVMII